MSVYAVKLDQDVTFFGSDLDQDVSLRGDRDRQTHRQTETEINRDRDTERHTETERGGGDGGEGGTMLNRQ